MLFGTADLFVREAVQIRRVKSEVWVQVGNRNFVKGSASAFGANNCLIHTLQQCIEQTICDAKVAIHDVRKNARYVPADGFVARFTR